MARRKCKKCNGEVIYKKYARFTWTLMFFCAPHYVVKFKDCGAVVNITKEEYDEVTKSCLQKKILK